MSQANAEQLLAIEHQGGVLLSAGAGSGKTFVLVRHLVFLALSELKNLTGLGPADQAEHLKKYFSRIVLMTFTNKATGELIIRIKGVVDQLDLDEETKTLLRQAFDEIHVSTIHGFCSRLISQGMIPQLPSGVRIVSDMERHQKIRSLFDQWLDRVYSGGLTLTSNAQEIISLNHGALLGSLEEVFSTPELRLQWKDYQVESSQELDLKSFLDRYFELIGLETLQEASQQLDTGVLLENKDKKWASLVLDFLTLSNDVGLSDMDCVESYRSFFAKVTRLSPPQAKLGHTEINSFYKWLGAFRDLMKGDLGDSLLAFHEHKNESYQEWLTLFKDGFEFIEERYLYNDAITFSDLEYYVLLGLRNRDVQQKIASHYSYFIVDEFQDTSFVQYEILKNVLGKNLERLFCVGDVKQAIYGFRGGELGVFRQCQEEIPLVLEMSNNYRSCPNIITFNNRCFTSLFALGLDFEGDDNFTVEVTHQTVPAKEFDSEGEVLIHQVDFASDDEAKKRLSSDEISQLEALELAELIKLRREQTPMEQVCVLYKTLKPSRYLIRELMSRGQSFTAQAKIKVSEEPLMALFGFLLHLTWAKKVTSTHLKMLGGFCHYLELNSDDLATHLQNYLDDLKTKGLLVSLQHLFWSLGIANSNWGLNYKALEELILMSGENVEKIAINLESISQQDFSLDFAYGESPNEVILMTAHGSKGLEFPHVLIGGIHNNGHQVNDHRYFGKIPGSFKWKSSSAQKKPFKSPWYLYEAALDKRKDFSESKRLFYVAATRAEKTLSFVDLSLNQEPLVANKNSWIAGLRKVLAEGIQVTTRKTMKELTSPEQNVEERPLFHQDTLGVTSRTVENPFPLICIPEMSVTGLSKLAQCPRKFYLSEVCKINGDRAVLDRETEVILKSSSERGSYLHELLSTAIQHNFVVPLSTAKSLDERDRKSLDWTLEWIKPRALAAERTRSETQMKFSVFGNMISGTADLILEGNPTRIIDFKTGREKSDHAHYWFQLALYAFGEGRTKELAHDAPFELTLLYIDEQKEKTQQLTWEQIQQIVKDQWSKLAKINAPNKEHCSSCEFGNLCLL